MIEMEIGGLGFDPRSMSPIVLLRDKEERNFLPIWIGMFEAAAIAMEMQKFSPPRPMTHDLIKEIIDKLGAELTRVVISDIKNNTFYAQLELRLAAPGAKKTRPAASDQPKPATAPDQADQERGPEKKIAIDCRPSDAIALAVRTKAPIYVTETVMLAAKMVNAEKDAEETKKFKEFVANLNPEDFTKYYGGHG